MTRCDFDLQNDQMPLVVPVLSTVVPDAQISASMSAALDLKALEKAQFMAMADNLVQELRPELERLTAELVRQTLTKAWSSRFHGDLG